MRRISVTLAAFVIAALLFGRVEAQTGGQFCVRAFEDRNGNGQIDGGEPFLTRGISAQLQDASGVVVASALLDNSPTATQGVICFTGLAYSQYTIVVTSSDYTATTPNTMQVAIKSGELPTVFDFGAQHVTVAENTTPTTAAGADRNALLERLVIAALGALAVGAIMIVLGGIVYVLAFRGSRQQMAPEPYVGSRTSTGPYPAVKHTDSGEYPKV